MERKDKDSLHALLSQTRERFQVISSKIHWTEADSGCLDSLAGSSEQKKDIAYRMTKVSGSRAFTDNFFSSFLAYKAWQRTKAVYSFNQELVDDIAKTDDTSLHTTLLEHLPYKDMLFFFPDGTLPKGKDEETAAFFIHIERHPELMWVMIDNYDRKCENGSEVFPGFTCALPITNGMKISQVFDTPQYQNYMAAYKRTVMFDHQLSEQEAEERLRDEKKTLNTAILLLYYLSAENADITAVKHHKKARKASPNKSDDSVPAIELHEVGNQYADIVYRQWKANSTSAENDIHERDDFSNEKTANPVVKTSKRRRPHVRRAHFQHYWIGKGRTTLVSRWKSDLFVGARRENQAVVVYEMPKESLKGKRNPNSSKKKQSK